MAVKYECPSCGKRFVEWGAEKLGFRCPHCENEELVKIGGQGTQRSSAKPTLRRRAKLHERGEPADNGDSSEIEDDETELDDEDDAADELPDDFDDDDDDDSGDDELDFDNGKPPKDKHALGLIDSDEWET